MKAESIQTDYNSAVACQKSVKIFSSPEEISELRNALLVLDRWKKEVFEATNFRTEYCDWHMLNFQTGFEMTEDMVNVTLEYGVCG